MRISRVFVTCLAVASLANGEGQAESCRRFVFTDVAQSAGLTFRHERGGQGEMHLPETMGAGLAWLDYDGDGLLDLYLVQSGPFPPGGSRSSDRLYRNLGDGVFEDVSARAGAGTRAYGQGVVAADVDGDRDTDLYLTRYGEDALLLNDGRGGLEVAGESSGLGLGGWSSSAAFADADGDLDLDLYVTRYLEYEQASGLLCTDSASGARKYCDPSLFAGATDRLFANLGDGVFEDVSERSGIAPANGRGLGVVFTDLDGDGRSDIYVANDLTLNFLFVNNGSSGFSDRSLISGAAVNTDGRPEAGMGIAVGDVDGDADPDLVVTNFDVETNTLYRNLGLASFEDVSAASGFGLPSFNQLAFGVVFSDFDHDGRLDAYVANGHIFEQPARDNVAYRQADQLLEGLDGGRFRPLECGPVAEMETVARGLATADYDNDGDRDLAVAENGGPIRLLQNDRDGRTWLGVDLVGKAPNTGGVGARLRLEAADRTQSRWVMAGGSYQSSNDPRPHFGAHPQAGESKLTVDWPAGKRMVLARPPAGRYLILYENR